MSHFYIGENKDGDPMMNDALVVLLQKMKLNVRKT